MSDASHPTPSTDPPERTSGQVWRLGFKILGIQVVTLVLLWVMQALYAGG